MESFFEYMYPFVGLIFVIGYLPQIKSLLFSNEDDGSMSISAWILWLLSNVLCAGYGFYVVKDLPLTLISGLDLLLCAVIIAMLVYNRHYRFNSEECYASSVAAE